ncbi:MAG: hypothetical protein DHS20C11_36200 [Lysobacteraceae bacterium]|nr:MAG: hypothetical protein DHS20C11_36200 [Xanthomonadaceae bacterium]
MVIVVAALSIATSEGQKNDRYCLEYRVHEFFPNWISLIVSEQLDESEAASLDLAVRPTLKEAIRFCYRPKPGQQGN